MRKHPHLSCVVVIAAMLGTFAVSTVEARTFWEQLSDSAPRSIFDDLRDSAPLQAPNKDIAGE